MANVTKIIANGKTFFNKDNDARNLIESLENNKQENITVGLPLSLSTDNKLTIDLENYYTRDENDSNLLRDKTELQKSITSNLDEINKIKSKLYDLLKEKINEKFENLETLPDISSYEDEIKNIKNRLDICEKNIVNNKEELNLKIEQNRENCESSLEDTNNNLNEKIDSNGNRLILLEREIFGKIYFNGNINDENTLSRIDTLEEKLNSIYDILVNIGLVKDKTGTEETNK